jgi:hypothetical protein
MREKHPIKDLINSDIVKDIFLELEDTSKFEVYVQDEMGKCRSRKMICFHEMEIEKNKEDYFDESGLFMSMSMKAVEKQYEIITYNKISIIKVNPEYATIEHSRRILDVDIDLKEVIERVTEYIGNENISTIHRSNNGLDITGRNFVTFSDDKVLNCPVVAIYFKSYSAEKYK